MDLYVQIPETQEHEVICRYCRWGHVEKENHLNIKLLTRELTLPCYSKYATNYGNLIKKGQCTFVVTFINLYDQVFKNMQVISNVSMPNKVTTRTKRIFTRTTRHNKKTKISSIMYCDSLLVVSIFSCLTLEMPVH